jgi:hypothetical protein
MNNGITLEQLNVLCYAMKRSENRVVHMSKELPWRKVNKLYIKTYLTMMTSTEFRYEVAFGIKGEGGSVLKYILPYSRIGKVREPEILEE